MGSAGETGGRMKDLEECDAGVDIIGQIRKNACVGLDTESEGRVGGS